MSSKSGKKRKHPASYHGSYYAKQQKNAGQSLGKSMKGFFVTCNMREKEATNEAYALLNDYATRLYGPEFKEEPKTAFWAEKASDDEEDIDEAIANEMAELKARNKSRVRRFQAVHSGASNILFIKTTLPDPYELFDAILTDAYNKKRATPKYIMRMYPVAGTCKLANYADEIEEMLKPFFSEAVGHSFYLKIKIRNNDGGMRDRIFKTFCYVIKGLNKDNKPNYNTYEYIVIIDVIKTILCVSVLKNYKLYKEYNLQTLGDPFLPDFVVEGEEGEKEEGKGDKAEGEETESGKGDATAETESGKGDEAEAENGKEKSAEESQEDAKKDMEEAKVEEVPEAQEQEKPSLEAETSQEAKEPSEAMQEGETTA